MGLEERITKDVFTLNAYLGQTYVDHCYRFWLFLFPALLSSPKSMALTVYAKASHLLFSLN